jgi:hypothetical protein
VIIYTTETRSWAVCGDKSLRGYVDDSSEKIALEPWHETEIRPPPGSIMALKKSALGVTYLALI